MSKMVRNIFILVAAMAVLGGLWYWLTMTEPETTQEETKAVYEVNPEDIVRFEVKTEGEEYTVYKEGERWLPVNRENTEILAARIDMWIEDISRIVPEAVVNETPDNLAEYGLETPIRTTKVIQKDGNSETLCIGNETPDKNSIYFKIASSDVVYTVSWKSKNEYAPMFVSLRAMDIMSAYSIENILSVEIYSRDNKETYEFKHMDNMTEAEKAQDFVVDDTVNYWKMVKPFVATANDEKLQAEVLQKLTAVWADDYIDDKPDNLAKYGLDNPQFTVKLNLADGTSKKLKIGNTVDSNMVADAASKVYLMAEDKPNVFASNKEYIQFVYSNIFEYLSSIPIITKLDSIQKTEFESDGMVYTLEPKSGGNASYLLNGKEISEGNFKEIYREIIGLTAYGVCDKNESVSGKEKIGDLKFTMTDGRIKNVSFVRKDDRNSIIIINGTPNFYILTKYINSMSETIKKYA